MGGARGAGPNESGTMSETYVHGYHLRENERLQDQAGALVDLLHADTAYPLLCLSHPGAERCPELVVGPVEASLAAM